MNLCVPYTQKWYINKIQSYCKTLNRTGKKYRAIRNEIRSSLDTIFKKFPLDKVLVFKNNNKKQFDNDTIGQWTIVLKISKDKELRFDKYYLTDNRVKYDQKIKIYN